MEFSDKDKLKFETEYINGIRMNNIKEKVYDNKWTFEFEGELNNEKWKGKEFNNKGEIIFEGEFFNYKKWTGRIKTELKSGNIYEGNILVGKLNGRGKKYDSRGILIFEGEYLKDERN